MFAKIFSQIFDSSIVEHPNTRFTFMDMLLLAGPTGLVDMTHEAIARRTNRPIDVIRSTIQELEAPDKQSRSPEHDGARLIRLDAHRDWGWQIVNYIKFREIRSELDRRRVATTANYGSYVYFLSPVGDEGKVKIGCSRNPWSRAMEMATGAPNGMILLGSIHGGPDMEAEWHERFRAVRLNGEWFTKTPELETAINSVVDSSLRKVVTRSYRSSKKKKQKKKKIIIPPNPPKGGIGKEEKSYLPDCPEAERLAKLFDRRPTTRWSAKEHKAFKALQPINPTDLEEVEKYYAREKKLGKNYLRSDLCTFLNNFPGEVDRAISGFTANKHVTPKSHSGRSVL